MPLRLDNQVEPIPGYRLIERLGRGGFGEVWKAEAPGGLLKAIKFVHGNLETASKDDGAAAEQELKALSRVKTVRHPFILSLERYDIVEGQLIIVMELADRNLWDRFRECRTQGLPGIPRDELLRYMDEAAEALDLMNQQFQLQHLDIKPQNLFLVQNHIKVADFGLVKDLEGMKASVTGGVTPLYAAPETFDGWVSRYCDQYSLAIVYQELLTGQRPFNGTNARQLIMQHLTAPPDLTSLGAGDREAIGRALAKKPDARFPTCTDLVRALRTQTGTVPAVPKPKEPAPSPPVVEPAGEAARSRAEEESAIDRDSHLPTARRSDFLPSPVQRPPDRSTPHRAAMPGMLGVVRGEGVLLPALVIGLGDIGLTVLQRLREGLHQRFGSLDALGHIRLLFIDTDADVMRRHPATGPAALHAQEILLARLNRPSYYVKPRENRPSLDPWFDPRTLYRISRNQTTGGIRSLGRLAFVDNHQALAQRLHDDLQAVSDPDAIISISQQTGLGVRSNQPRVYIVAGLGGGTGSGMFLDLAYLARQQLRKLGYPQQDVVGAFLVPTVEAVPARRLALANTCAALNELLHYSSPRTVYRAHLDPKGPALEDPGAPFSRCVLMQLPPPRADHDDAGLAGLVGGFLLRDLTTPLGREADRQREAAAAPGGVPIQTFGLYRLAWPRLSLRQRVTRGLCLRLVEHWIARDRAVVQAGAEAWVADQWARRKLVPESLLDLLEAHCEQALGEAPESALGAITNRLARRGPGGLEVEMEAAAPIFQNVLNLLGRPGEEGQGTHNGALVATLDQAIRQLTMDSEQQLAEMAVQLVEQPQFRLAGAEAAIRRITVLLEEQINGQRDICSRLANQAADLFTRLQTQVQALQANPAAARRKTNFLLELVEAFRLYPETRFRALVLEGVVSVYRHLLSNCPEYLRELSFCRVRLSELHKAIASRPVLLAETDLGPAWNLLPPGCRNLDDAAERVLKEISQDELLDFDQGMQGLIRRQFKALVHVCMTAANLLKDLELLLYQRADGFTTGRLGKASAVETLLEQHARGEDAGQILSFAYAGAEPKLAAALGPGRAELSILAVPADPAADRVGDLARRLLPHIQLVTTASGDDIVFYRECHGFDPGQLPQLGPVAQDAYRQLIETEHFTPHSRVDIGEWQGR